MPTRPAAWRAATGSTTSAPVTGHNADPVAPGAGSAVFVHLWRRPRWPTAGCIAFRRPDLEWILARWRPGSRPMIRERGGLSHAPGQAQVDFGETLGEISGVQRKLHYFAMALPPSDAFFVKAYQPPRAWTASTPDRGPGQAFKVIASLNKTLVMELARCEFIDRRENVIALGPSGAGKTHIALGLGLAACQKGLKVRFITAAAVRQCLSDHWRSIGSLHELTEAADDRRLQRLQKLLTNQDLRSAGLRGPTGATVPPHHRRAGLRPPRQDRRRAALRDHLPTLRARLHHHHIQPRIRSGAGSAFRRMDRGLRVRTPDRRHSGPPDCESRRQTGQRNRSDSLTVAK